MSESTTSSELSEVALRQKLSSVAWVQCDNTSCMKWRKIKKEIADKLTSDTWWECSKNDDCSFNTCTAPEEDLESFDRLAKRAKLVVFKSELTPGSLVWAKTQSYCQWPALITVDPMNGEYYAEGEEDEPDKGHYHVEYLGKRRCHCWVLTRCVELFGEGNATKTFRKEKKSGNPAQSHESKSSRKRKRSKFSCDKQCGKKEMRRYCGEAVDEVIKEALRLLPLSHKQRLETCHFIKVNGIKASSKSLKIKQNKPTKAEKSAKESNHNSSDVKRRKNKRFCPEKNETLVKQSVNIQNCDQISDVDESDADNSSQRQRDMWSFDFLTSLVDVTKEERLFLDIKTYKEKECNFLNKLGNFFSHCGLHSIEPPVWQGSKVSLFDFVLSVHDRGGFKEVNSTGQWTSVFFEVTNFPSKGGGAKAKSFYKKYLYPYELYTKGEDYWVALKHLKSHIIKSSKSTFGQSSKKSDCSIENEDLEKALDELDDLLQSLKENDSVVPDLYENDDNEDDLQHCDNHIQASWDTPIDHTKTYLLNPTTGSHRGRAAEPDEDAQVVPEIDFPSFSGSSPPSEGDSQSEMEHDQNLPQIYLEDSNGEEWVLQELQALEHNL